MASGYPSLAADCPPLFAGISPVEYDAILAASHPCEFQRGDVFYLESEPVKDVLLLTSGLVKVTKYGLSGTEVILRLSGSGDVLGLENLILDGAHRTTVQAFRGCQALVWDAPAFRALIDPYPILHRNIARIASGHLLELEERFREMATEKVGPRVARQIVRLLDQIGRQTDGGIEIGVSREELAQMTGTTLFTVSRLLSAWETLGVVAPRREAVAVFNIDTLHSLAGGFPDLKHGSTRGGEESTRQGTVRLTKRLSTLEHGTARVSKRLSSPIPSQEPPFGPFPFANFRSGQ